VSTYVEPRRVVLENVFNLRDLGGYPSGDGRVVAAGQLFRADGLNRLSERDAEVVRDLGIRTVVDLRTAYERREWGSAPVDLLGATSLHLPLISELWPSFDEPDDHDPVAYLIERYHEMTVEGAASLATFLRLAAGESDATPLVFHCSAGKDRTGVTAALLLGLLGVDEGQIAADYAHTAVAMDEMVAWIRRVDPDAASTMVDQPRSFLACPAEAMSGFLAELAERFGSIEGYVESIGVESSAVERLRERYLTAA
jgi:protein tyrosine/serine phosphatase